MGKADFSGGQPMRHERRSMQRLILVLAVLLAFPLEAISMDSLRISSTAFSRNGMIPEKYTCDGSDINPPLAIEHVPPQAKSLALIVDDPDAPAGTWVHWVVWNIPPATKEIAEHSLPQGAQEGMNDFRRNKYGGPCPPSGTHRYFFKLYALDAALPFDAKTTKASLERAMQGHILAQDELVGRYSRR